jgi:hypothetical protein
MGVAVDLVYEKRFLQGLVARRPEKQRVMAAQEQVPEKFLILLLAQLLD